MKRHTNILLVLAVSLTLTIGISVAKATEGKNKSSLSIKEARLGTGVENRTLIGKGDTFTEGAQVYFFTSVVGGKAGDIVSHVWIRNEKEKFRVELNIGSPSWRTWSSKTLYHGSLGKWVVEVHDRFGKLLDSMSFECIPKTPE